MKTKTKITCYLWASLCMFTGIGLLGIQNWNTETFLGLSLIAASGFLSYYMSDYWTDRGK